MRAAPGDQQARRCLPDLGPRERLVELAGGLVVHELPAGGQVAEQRDSPAGPASRPPAAPAAARRPSAAGRAATRRRAARGSPGRIAEPLDIVDRRCPSPRAASRRPRAGRPRARRRRRRPRRARKSSSTATNTGPPPPRPARSSSPTPAGSSSSAAPGGSSLSRGHWFSHCARNDSSGSGSSGSVDLALARIASWRLSDHPLPLRASSAATPAATPSTSSSAAVRAAPTTRSADPRHRPRDPPSATCRRPIISPVANRCAVDTSSSCGCSRSAIVGVNPSSITLAPHLPRLVRRARSSTR